MVYTVSDMFWKVMEIIPGRLSVYTRTQICVLIFILDSNHNVRILTHLFPMHLLSTLRFSDALRGKRKDGLGTNELTVIRYVSYRFSEPYFSSVDTKLCSVYEARLFNKVILLYLY